MSTSSSPSPRTTHQVSQFANKLHASWRKVDLRRLILALTISSALIALANTFYASYQVQRQELIYSTLESNSVYAQKLASSTEDFFQTAMQQLAYSAKLIARDFENSAFLDAESERLLSQTDSFNSILVIDAKAQVRSTSPQTFNLVGQTLYTEGAQLSVRTKAPLISKPFLSAAANYLIFISHPVLASDGTYLGAVAGTIYLRQKSILNRLLGTHPYHDGSYLYVVDQQRNLIYHPNPQRVGEAVHSNEVIDDVVLGGAGKRVTTNSKGITMLAGYAPVPTAGWGVVAQRPQDATLSGLDSMMGAVLRNALPLSLVSLVVIVWCARKISNPLKQLADNAHAMDEPAAAEKIHKINSWYFESAELKSALLVGMGAMHTNINQLNVDIQTDPLTGLSNRRTLNQTTLRWQATQTSFSVVSIDIDHFKQINDRFGHDTGDQVLQQLATIMRDCSRGNDVLCRMGGEEFVILLPGADRNVAQQVAERLRQRVADAVLPAVGHITISIGIAEWPHSHASMATVFKMSDQALYRAKRNGRNRVEVQETSEA